MRAVNLARKFIEHDPVHPAAQTLSRLVRALESDAAFPIGDIYALDFDRFQLALKILDEWRLERYYAGTARPFEAASRHVQ